MRGRQGCECCYSALHHFGRGGCSLGAAVLDGMREFLRSSCFFSIFSIQIHKCNYNEIFTSVTDVLLNQGDCGFSA